MSIVYVRLDDETRATLEDAANQAGIDLSTYLSRMAETEAERVRRERIREQSRTVGRYVDANPLARAFYEDWGTPTADGNGR